jgi:pyrroloquinoline quinone biosynthesis protein D
MSAALTVDSRPALAPSSRLQHDTVRRRWIVQAPERLFVLDEIAYAVLSRCGRGLSIADIVGELGAEFDAPAGEIAGDVIGLLQDLADKGVVHDQPA